MSMNAFGDTNWVVFREPRIEQYTYIVFSFTYEPGTASGTSEAKLACSMVREYVITSIGTNLIEYNLNDIINSQLIKFYYTHRKLKIYSARYGTTVGHGEIHFCINLITKYY